MIKNHLQNKRLWLVALAVGFSQIMFAQGGNPGSGGQSAIAGAAQEVAGYMDSMEMLMYAIGAIVGLVGVIRVYIKWNNGDQDVQKAVIGWLGAAIFLVAAGAVIRAFFL